MPKKRFTEDNWRSHPWFRSLCASLLSCRTEEEMALLLRDIGTLSELQAWSERLEVAKQLSSGLTYRQVAANTQASTTTVTRVAKFVENGAGYRRIIGKGKEKSASDTNVRKAKDIHESLVKKYLQPQKQKSPDVSPA